MLIKILPWVLILALVLGAFAGTFFYGNSVGYDRCELELKTAIIEEGKQDVIIENKQSAIRANRDNYNLSERLQRGTF